jgi:hypothetical protein
MTTTIDPAGLIPRRRYIILSAAGVSLASPGVAKIKGAGSPREWDIRKGYGFSGASLVFTGTGLAKFDVDIFIWEDAHWVAWELFSALLTNPPPPPGVMPTSLGIDHPLLNKKPWLITKVVVEDISSWEVSDTGLWSLTISMLQYRKPKPAILPPLEGPPGTSVAPVPLTAQQKINAALDTENAALRAAAAPKGPPQDPVR